MVVSDQYGVYHDFPTVIHHQQEFTTVFPIGLLKSAFIEAFIRLNKTQDKVPMSRAGKNGSIAIHRVFEVGIADGMDFRYLDEEECEKVRRWIFSLPKKKNYDPLDFVLFIHYRGKKDSSGKPFALNYDQYFIRVNFQKSLFNFNHFHGLQRTPPDEILKVIILHSNEHLQQWFSKNPQLEKRFKLESLRRAGNFVDVIPRG